MWDRLTKILFIIIISLFIITLIHAGWEIKNSQPATVDLTDIPSAGAIKAMLEIEPMDAEEYVSILEEQHNKERVEEYMYDAEDYISNLHGDEKEINQKILDIRESDISNAEKVSMIAWILYEKGNIIYELGENFMKYDNRFYDTDFELPGCYYKSNMKLDCSAFVQYLIYISTGTSLKHGITIGRSTYFSSIEGKSVAEPVIGTLCFRFNGGSHILRHGEIMKENEQQYSESNHVAIYLGDNKFIDCSESAGGLRIINTEDRPFFNDYFTWFRDVLETDEYISDLEYNYYDWTVKE